MSVTVAPRTLVPLAATVSAAVALAFGAWIADSAHGQDAMPQPDCSGLVFTDPAGDQGIPQGSVPIIPAPDNLDITGVFFRYDSDPDAKTPVTANIRVANLDKSLPLASNAASWYVEWTVASTIYYVKADLDSAGAVVYDYGVDDPTTGLTSSGATTGKLFEGKDGIVQIRVPQAGTKAVDGGRLTQTLAHTSATLPGLLVFADNAPDSGSGKSYTVAQCPGGAAAGNDTGTTPASTTLPVKLLTSSAKAAKGKKGKSLSFKLQSTEQVTGLKGTLKKGSTTYGAGKLASLNGKGTLKVKLKKALKKGSFKLQLSGTTAGGARKATFTVKVS
jgi:hypothetical protein